jgi:thymidylate synthase (FAD)
MTLQFQVQNDPNYIPLWDHGFVGLKDVMGDDKAIVEAARVSYGDGTKSVNEDRGLIRYLMRHQHSTPFEMVEFKFHLKIPIFVMRQHVRHRMASINEYSGRYSIMTDEFYLPVAERMKAQSQTNKQGSGDGLVGDELLDAIDIIKNISKNNYDDYLFLISNNNNRQGLARELARIILPVNNYTELYWKINLKNLFHYIKLRADSHAQEEIQQLANSFSLFVKKKCPMAWEAFEDYWQNSITISSMENKLLNAILSISNQKNQSISDAWIALQNQHNDINGLQKAYGLSKREMQEFKMQWKLL